MIAADRAVQRPASARLLVIDAAGRVTQSPRARWLDFLERGDLVVANDAATLPASLAGVHARTGQPIEVRLAAWRSPVSGETAAFDAIVFGSGDYRTRTEDRPPPPELASGDEFVFGTLTATVVRLLDHPRFVRLRFAAAAAAFWQHLARRGRPIQYAHLQQPIALWDSWTSIAAAPVAFEPPSAGFVIAWRDVASMRERGIGFATLTHAAGLSSTGDATLDRRLPLAEWYRISASTAAAIADTRARRGAHRSRSARRSCAPRARGEPARRRSRGRAPGDAADRCAYAAAHRRCARHRHARAGQQPPRAAARVRVGHRAGRRRAHARPRRLSHARVRRFDARVRRRPGEIAPRERLRPARIRWWREARGNRFLSASRRIVARLSGLRLATLAAAEYVVVSSNGAGSDPTSVTPGV